MEKSKCCICGKQLSYYKKKPSRCRDCYRKHMNDSPNKGISVQFNTGRTHFKKGMVPWNKGLKRTEEENKAQSKRLKGKPMPKPEGFSETMRKANPPKGRKIKFDSRDKAKKRRVWRGGYVFVYVPDHPSSRKTPPDYGYMAEHRMIIEDSIGRPLTPKDIIHHIDGRKDNNDIDNLLHCKSQSEHKEVHNKMEIFVEGLIREGIAYYDRDTEEFRLR